MWHVAPEGVGENSSVGGGVGRGADGRSLALPSRSRAHCRTAGNIGTRVPWMTKKQPHVWHIWAGEGCLEEDQPNPGVELASGILASREGQPTAVASLARLRI